MEAVKIKLYQNMVNYRREMSFGYVQSYPLPTPSMVRGMVHALIGAKSGANEYYPLKVSIQGKYSTVVTNMQKVYKFDRYRAIEIPISGNNAIRHFVKSNSKYEFKPGKKEDKGKLIIKKGEMLLKEKNQLIKYIKDDDTVKNKSVNKQDDIETINSYFQISQNIELRRLAVKSNDKNATLNQGIMFVDQLVDVNLILHIVFEDNKLNQRLYEAVNSSVIVLGRNEDIARVDECRIVQIEKCDDEIEITNCMYIPEGICKQKQLLGLGTAYRLPFRYANVENIEDKRIFEFVNVRYIDSGKTIEVDDLFLDDENNPVAFLSINND